MHMQGSPQSMQNSPMYPRGVVAEVQDFLFQQAQILLQNGLKKERIFLDPGIGFGKTLEDNLKILNAIPELKKLGFPLLFGVSRKSFIQKITGRSALNALAGTLAVNMCLMKENVNIIRVHDVSEHVDLRAIYAELGGNK